MSPKKPRAAAAVAAAEAAVYTRRPISLRKPTTSSCRLRRWTLAEMSLVRTLEDSLPAASRPPSQSCADP